MAVLLSDGCFDNTVKWLQKHLPESIVVYNVLQLILEGKWTFLKVWVDSTENPCVLVMRADKVKCQNLYIRRHLYIYSSSPEDDSKIERILRAADVIDVSETCVAYALQERLVAVVTPIVHSLGLTNHQVATETFTYIMDKCSCVSQYTIPDGFNIGDVLPEMTGLINSKWKFSNNGAAEVMKEVLQWGHPSVCVSTQDGTPVAWALQNFCGIVSNLFTEEEYRMKGIGTFVLSHLTRLILERGENVFVSIEKKNEISIRMHEKLGFKRYNERMNFSWVVYSPK